MTAVERQVMWVSSHHKSARERSVCYLVTVQILCSDRRLFLTITYFVLLLNFNDMHCSVILLILFLLCAVCAPPPTKRPRIELCVVQTPEFLGTRTPCDDGDLQKLVELANQEIPTGQSFGAKDLANLVLTRSGIFSEQPDLENLHICKNIKTTLVLNGWKIMKITQKCIRTEKPFQSAICQTFRLQQINKHQLMVTANRSWGWKKMVQQQFGENCMFSSQ